MDQQRAQAGQDQGQPATDRDFERALAAVVAGCLALACIGAAIVKYWIANAGSIWGN